MGLEIKECSQSCRHELCHQGRCGFLKQAKGTSASLRVLILFEAAVASRAVIYLVSMGAPRAGQVRFTQSLAGRSNESVVGSGGGTMPALSRAHLQVEKW